jgi:hypothetical protein
MPQNKVGASTRYRLPTFKNKILTLIIPARALPARPFTLFSRLTFTVALGLIVLICYALGNC